MESIISAKNIIKSYGGKNPVNVLKNVGLTVKEGDFICIMGPSGSGKSTFLNVISTVDRPSKGTIEINGKDIFSMTDKQIGKFRYESMGFIFQEFNLIDSLTIRENVGVPLILAGEAKEEINKKTESIINELNISEIIDKFPEECSGGQRQRAAAARALVTNPKLIIADEPTENLDSKNSHELLKIIKERNEKHGTAVLMVTHDSMIASYAKTLIFLRDGKIEETLERNNLTQKEFFYKIVDITSRESQSFFDIA